MLRHGGGARSERAVRIWPLSRLAAARPAAAGEWPSSQNDQSGIRLSFAEASTGNADPPNRPRLWEERGETGVVEATADNGVM
jgi:hypothetical protein